MPAQLPTPDDSTSAPRPAPKIDVSVALEMLGSGQSKADLSRFFRVSRSAISQRLRGHWPPPPTPSQQAQSDVLGQLEAIDPDLAGALRQHAQITVEPALVRIVVKGNADARLALKALPTRRRALAELWSQPVGICW